MASAEDFIKQLADLEAKIAAKQGQIPALKVAESQWRVQSQVSCGGSGKSKQRCIDDKIWKKSKADAIKSTIDSLNSQIARLVVDKKSVLAARDAFNQSAINLSKDGKSLEALVIESAGVAKAAEVDASGRANAINRTAEAEANAITTQAGADAESTKTTMIVIAIIGGVVALLVIVIVIAKFKKLKQKK